MRRLLIALLFALLSKSLSLGQVHVFPALDTNNPWTGTNTFNGITVLPGGISGPVTPTTPGGFSLGTSLFPYSSAFVGNGAVNNIQITGIATAARVFTLPDANSNPVQPSTCVPNNFETSISSAGVIGCAPAVVASSAAANQFAVSISASGVLGYAQPSFTNLSGSITLSQIVNLGTSTTLLHGNAAGNASFSGLSLTADTTANQGTTTTVLHGNAAGQPSFGAVSLTTDVSGVAPTTNGGTGQNSTATFPTSGVVGSGTGTTNTISKFTNGATGVQGNSSITDDGTTIATSENLAVTGNVTEATGQNQYLSFKSNKSCYVDGNKFTAIASALADTTNCVLP